MFERQGLHLFAEVHIDFVQAALGAEIEIPLVDGEESFTIKPGTQSGTQIILRGQGMPETSGYIRGDLVIALVVDIPTKLDSRQKEILQEYAEHSKVAVSSGRTGIFQKLRGKA